MRLIGHSSTLSPMTSICTSHRGWLPSGRVIIDSEKPVAAQSAYTVVVARLMELFDGPNLVLNTNYGGKDIPVPKGVRPVPGNGVGLSQ